MSIKLFFEHIGSALKKAFKVTNIEKIIGFLSFEAISFYFSLSMFLQIGTTFQGKVAMGISTVAAESFKVMLITALSSSGHSLAYYSHRLKMGKEYLSVYLKHLRTYILAFIFYFITAAVSFIATVGFGLSTTYQYSQINRIVDNSSAISTLQTNMDRYSAEIKKYELLNAEDQKSADSYRVTADQFNTVETRSNRNYYLGLVTGLISKMEKRNAQIALWNSDITKWSSEIIALQTIVTDDGQDKQKSIFDLMELSLNGGLTAENIMLLITIILALVIEIGLVYTAPKIKELDEEKDFELYPNYKPKKKEIIEEKTPRIKKTIEIQPPIEEQKVDIKAEIAKALEEEKLKMREEIAVQLKSERELEEKLAQRPEPEEKPTEFKIVETTNDHSKNEDLVIDHGLELAKKGLSSDIKDYEKLQKEELKVEEKSSKEIDPDTKKAENFISVINKMHGMIDEGKKYLLSEEELSSSNKMPLDKVKKIYKYLEYLQLIELEKVSGLWKPKRDKKMMIDIIKSKLIASQK